MGKLEKLELTHFLDSFFAILTALTSKYQEKKTFSGGNF
jgi:hypothetical protein